MTRLSRSARPATRRSRRSSGRPGSWRLQEAKARFSELVRRAKTDGPQHVTVHGREEVVILGADEFRRLSGERSGQALVDVMRASPHRDVRLETSRARLQVRDVRL